MQSLDVEDLQARELPPQTAADNPARDRRSPRRSVAGKAYRGTHRSWRGAGRRLKLAAAAALVVAGLLTVAQFQPAGALPGPAAPPLRSAPAARPVRSLAPGPPPGTVPAAPPARSSHEAAPSPRPTPATRPAARAEPAAQRPSTSLPGGPDGVPAAQVGSLVLSDSAAGLATWSHTLTGSDCTAPGTIALAGSVLDLTTSGAASNCAEITSPARYTYGIFETRFAVPAGAGGTIAAWPAFWLTGQNWPVDGEIDAFEGLSGTDRVSYHYGADDSTLSKNDPALGPGPVTVDVVWEPDLLAVYYNGREFVQWNSSVITAQPLSVLFDYTSASSTGQPATMQISYLKIWTAR